MAIKTGTNSVPFHSGRGNVSMNLAKPESEIMHHEAEKVDSEELTPQVGDKVNDSGAKPEFMTGSQPFHTGRGLGRGHGPETK